MPDNAQIIKKMGLEDITHFVKIEMRNSVRNVITVGFCLKVVKDGELFKEKYTSFREYAKAEFNLSESEASRYISLNTKYSQGGNSCEVTGSYEQYSVGVLIEMLNMDEVERKEIPVEATVRDVRQLKKEKQELATSQEVKEDMPVVGLPKTEYVEKCKSVCQSPMKEETILEAEYREVEEVPKQSAFPFLKNKEQREQFIDSYKEWPIWFETEQTEETCYRYDLPDKSSIAVRSYLVTDYWNKKEHESAEFFLLKEGQHFRSCKTSMTELIEHLKEVQKGVVNG